MRKKCLLFEKTQRTNSPNRFSAEEMQKLMQQFEEDCKEHDFSDVYMDSIFENMLDDFCKNEKLGIDK